MFVCSHVALIIMSGLSGGQGAISSAVGPVIAGLWRPFTHDGSHSIHGGPDGCPQTRDGLDTFQGDTFQPQRAHLPAKHANSQLGPSQCWHHPLLRPPFSSSTTRISQISEGVV